MRHRNASCLLTPLPSVAHGANHQSLAQILPCVRALQLMERMFEADLIDALRPYLKVSGPHDRA
jgi:hypothetical protein